MLFRSIVDRIPDRIPLCILFSWDILMLLAVGVGANKDQTFSYFAAEALFAKFGESISLQQQLDRY